MDIYDIYFNNIEGSIIPHAGYKYAGLCRNTIFSNINFKDKLKYIIFIAALHDNLDVENNKTYILYYDSLFKNIFFRNDNINNYIFDRNKFTKGILNEHSYEFIKNEIETNFPNSKILVLCPTSKTNLKTLANDIINCIFNIKNNYDRVHLFATTDLTHYGSRFNNLDMFKKPVQYNKWKLEENLILNLLNNKIDNSDLDKICGIYSIQTFLYISDYFKWKSRVVDYYDSANFDDNLLIDKYSIKLDKNISEFVSYISIIYGNFINFNNKLLLPIDIIMALSLIKTNLYLKLSNDHNNDNEFILPKWNTFNNINNGIFISIFSNNNTNSCIGQFQKKTNDVNSSIKISNCCKNLISDSINRWNNPIDINNLNNIDFKIEILDDISFWKTYNSINTNNLLNMNSNKGVYLELYNNKNATFLPNVLFDMRKLWNIDNYMNNLSLKAGGYIDDWKNIYSIIKIYDTISFKFLNEKNLITTI
jgi:AmmeMemoRadiSam system protein B